MAPPLVKSSARFPPPKPPHSHISLLSHPLNTLTHTRTQTWTRRLTRYFLPPAVLPAFRAPNPSLVRCPRLPTRCPPSSLRVASELPCFFHARGKDSCTDMANDHTDTRKANDMNFLTLGETQFTSWVVTNPGQSEARDSRGNTPLWAAARRGSYDLVSYLLVSRGVDANGRTSNGSTAIHHAIDADVLGFLMDRGAEPVVRNDKGWTPLMHHVRAGRPECVARLLDDPRVRASIDAVVEGDDFHGFSALHLACCFNNITPTAKLAILRHLLVAGADPTLPNAYGHNSLQILQEHPPVEPLDLALVKEAIDAERAACLIKTRQVAGGRSEAWTWVEGSGPEGERGEGMPSLQLDMEDEEGHLMAFLMGLQSEEGRSGMPHGVFVVVMSMLIPPWHALREGIKGVK